MVNNSPLFILLIYNTMGHTGAYYSYIPESNLEHWETHPYPAPKTGGQAGWDHR